jgi:ribose transport system ATP-binding protein
METLRAPALAIRGLTKTFGAVTVLNDINLHIHPGEFVGLMGPNGAGKSTLIKILDGVYEASSGEIRLGDEKVSTLGGRSDVGFIHQDLGLVDAMSVLDNLRLGERPMRSIGPILNRRAERESALEALERVSMAWAVDTPVEALAPGEQALVAVARALARGARILFVDEATSTLPYADAKRVIESLEQSAAQGVTIVMVTHKLHEILDATHRVVVLLDGRLAADQKTEGMDRAGLVKLLLQHETAKVGKSADNLHSAHHTEGAEPLLEMVGAYGGRAGPVDMAILPGEALGLTGLPGSGLHDIAFLAYGSMRPTGGTVRTARGVRVALVPPYRETQGGFNELSVHENVTVSSLWRWVVRIGLMALGRERRDSQEMVTRLNVKPNRIDESFGVLSGGNKQKVIFGRALLNEPKVYVLCEPTRGVDVGTRSEIYRLIEEIIGTGAGVLVVSSDAEDLFAVCDAVAVVEEGRLSEVRLIENMQLKDLEVLI